MAIISTQSPGTRIEIELRRLAFHPKPLDQRYLQNRALDSTGNCSQMVKCILGNHIVQAPFVALEIVAPNNNPCGKSPRSKRLQS